MKIRKYLKLQIKRTSLSAPFAIAATAILVLVLALAAKAYFANYSESENKAKLKIGIVGDMSESYLSLGVTALKNLDSTRFSIDFEAMNEQTASDALKKKQLTAYVVIPETFVDSISHGEIEKIRYCTTGGALSIITVLKDEIASEVSELLIASQRGVYGVYDAMRSSGIEKNEAREKRDLLSLQYIDFIIRRNELFNIDVIGISDGLSVPAGFLCGISVFFLLIWGITCSPLFAGNDRSVNRILAAKRLSPLRQILCEYAAYFLLMFIMILLLLIAAAFMLPDISSVIPELEGIDTVWLFLLIFKLIPVALTLSALQFLLYELSTGLVGGVLMQFLTAAGLSYISGCIYPIGFFPEAVGRFSAFLPSGIARGYLARIFLGESLTGGVAKLTVYAAALIALTVLIRKHRLNGRKAGSL